MKKWFAIVPIAAIVIGALIYLFTPSTKATDPSEIKTAKIEKGELRLEVVANGTVTPEIEVAVKSKAGGEITNFPFNEGDIIKKGQVIVKLDPRTERARANQAEANLLIAKAKLEKAKISQKDSEIKLTRNKKLFEDGIISRQELDDSEITFEKSRSDVKLAEAELIQTKEALNEANERFDDTQIKAPFTGTILKKSVDVGQVISSTLSSASEGTQIFSMANLDKIFVNAQVDEVDIGRVKVGQAADIAIDSIPNKIFEGRVERISPKGKIERTVTIFEVVIMITDKDKGLLRPGMTSDVKILTELIKDVVLVPNEALKVKEKKTGVYTMKAGQPEFIQLKTGETDGIKTVVAEGIEPGTEVVTSGINTKPEKKNRKRLFF
ncbi:MAG: efflux RND transporter periplasmic adaptor subunit [Deltaproteobacteria bacterium]|nr:efflux RND transporter periplasmic adaptor subunit [Deltaproteobacteria bacterium]